MPNEIRIWKVGSDDTLQELRRRPLDLEARLEAWIDENVAILAANLLVIGRQVETAYGGYIDLLCVDQDGIHDHRVEAG